MLKEVVLCVTLSVAKGIGVVGQNPEDHDGLLRLPTSVGMVSQ